MKMTTAQALVRFLKVQKVERDGVESPFFCGIFGIFGHGNVAGIGQALQENPDFRFIPVRNEQAGVHMAVGYARMKRRLGTWACTSSIGPGATNMVTGAALATINRLPVLILPGDIFARRNVQPVLQQLECEWSQDCSVNDCFKPVSRYFDRINRPEQLIYALYEAMRVLTSQADTGAVTISLPQDVQSESFDFPESFLQPRVWHIYRQIPPSPAIQMAKQVITNSFQPLIIAGGGVIYSEAERALWDFSMKTGIPISVTQSGKGSVSSDHPYLVGGIGVTGTKPANILANQADLIIGIGTRYTDFTTSSKTLFQNPDLMFVNINVTEKDALKHNAIPIIGDAKVTIETLSQILEGYHVKYDYKQLISNLQTEWEQEISNITKDANSSLTQAQILVTLNEMMNPKDVIINAAGSAPGDLHKLWRVKDPLSYYVEYGYSCMGYEIGGAIGAKLAEPDREVVAFIGDGSFLMMNSDLSTAIQEGIKIIVVLNDNHGFSSISGLSKSLGCEGFGCYFRERGNDGALSGKVLPIDFEAIACGLGARAFHAKTVDEFRSAFEKARKEDKSCVIVVETDIEKRLKGYSWWDVPPAEISQMEGVKRARAEWENKVKTEKWF